MSQDKISAKVLFAIFATGILSFCGVAGETAMNITFPILMKEFEIDTATVQWVTTIYLLVVACVVPLSAYLKRSFKMKAIFLVGNLLSVLGVLIDFLAPSFSFVVLGRLVQGMGVGFALPLMFNIILEQVPKRKIGLMMGVGTLITAIAPAIGPTVGGLLTATFGWRSIFLVQFPILLASLVAGLRSIEQMSKVKRESLDLMSLFSIIALFVGLILGIHGLADHPFLSFFVLGWLVIGILGLVLLVWRSNQLETPIINLAILKNPFLTGHLLAFFTFQLGSLALSFLLPNYVQLVNHSSTTLAALMLLPGALIGAGFAPFSGLILDKLGARKPILLGAAFILLAHFHFTLFALKLSNSLTLIFYMIFMTGMGLAFGNIMTNGQKQLSLEEQPDANAIFNTLQQFAGAVGITLASLIVAMSQANQKMDFIQATAKGSRNGFMVLFALAIFQLLLLFWVVGKENETN